MKKHGFLPEVLNLFLFIPYDERLFMESLEREYGWHKPSDQSILGHNDCLIHEAADYLYLRKFGWHRLANELSVLIRRGMITREEGRERLAHSSPDPGPVLDELLEKLDLQKEDLEFLPR